MRPDGRAYTPRGPLRRPAATDVEPAAIVGRRPVLEALRSGRPLVRILIAEAAQGDDARTGGAGPQGSLRAILGAARDIGVPVERVVRTALDRLAGGAAHQGVCALPAASAYAPAGSVLARALADDGDPFLLLVDGVEDPRNLGSLLRTAEAAGVHGAVLPERRAAGLTATAVKASAGAVAHLPVERVTNLSRYLDELKRAGLWIVAADPTAERTVFEADLRGPIAIVVGGEGSGLHRLVRERCDLAVRLPMLGEVESLNVSVAGALLMYEVVRQRTSTQPTSSTSPASV